MSSFTDEMIRRAVRANGSVRLARLALEAALGAQGEAAGQQISAATALGHIRDAEAALTPPEPDLHEKERTG